MWRMIRSRFPVTPSPYMSQANTTNPASANRPAVCRHAPRRSRSTELDPDDVYTLEASVQRFDGKLALVIPLNEGGDKFVDVIGAPRT